MKSATSPVPLSGATLLAAAMVCIAAANYGLWCALGFFLIYGLGRSQ